MRRISHARGTLLSLVAVVMVVPLSLTAGQHARKHPRYKLVDLGTLGGPISYGSANGEGSRLLNNSGMVSSYADTQDPDPFAPDFCFDADCLVAHAYRWHHGIIRDLGALADGYSSVAASINDFGWSVGASQTGILDPVFGFPQTRAVLWTHLRMIDLTTLPGGSFSIGVFVNSAGQAVGVSDNGVPDPFSMFGVGIQSRTFLWERGRLRDIGTLGGPDANAGAGCNNQRPGVIVGGSYTGFTPNDATAFPP